MAGETILIVDDNPSNLKLVKILLHDKKYNLFTALDSEQTFEVLKTIQPQLILMDIHDFLYLQYLKN